MTNIVITGKKPLMGEVAVSGSKNAALPILAATLLCEKPCKITNVPWILDISNLKLLLERAGESIQRNGQDFFCEMGEEIHPVADYEATNRLRASFLVAGPMLARTGTARVAYPGGCPIGARPVDLHLKGFAKMGATVACENGDVILKANKLKGTNIYLDFPSVGATENLMMAATLAQGTTVLENAAAEPEIVDLANFLNTMGARVEGAGTDTITIYGVESLSGGEYRVIPDRIEAGTYLLAAALTGGKIKVTNVVADHLSPIIAKLKEAGVHITSKGNSVTAEGRQTYRAVDIKTLPYPGFPTDMQAQFCAFLCRAKGTSIVSETVFENRFLHLPELMRMGAKITVDGRTAVIEGVSRLNGARVRASDLRGAAALVLAGLCAEGTTIVEDSGHLFRGYQNMVENLRSLGADICLTEE